MFSGFAFFSRTFLFLRGTSFWGFNYFTNFSFIVRAFNIFKLFVRRRIHFDKHFNFLTNSSHVSTNPESMYEFLSRNFIFHKAANVVSNKTGQCNFARQRDRSTYLHCPGTNGQRDKLKILSWDGIGQDSLSKSGTGRRTRQSAITFFL